MDLIDKYGVKEAARIAALDDPESDDDDLTLGQTIDVLSGSQSRHRSQKKRRTSPKDVEVRSTAPTDAQQPSLMLTDAQLCSETLTDAGTESITPGNSRSRDEQELIDWIFGNE